MNDIIETRYCGTKRRFRLELETIFVNGQIFAFDVKIIQTINCMAWRFHGSKPRGGRHVTGKIHIYLEVNELN